MTGKLLTHAERFRWIEGVLANPAFTHAQARVLVRLAMHLNVATGRCDPAINTIAVGAAVSSRAVKATREDAAYAYVKKDEEPIRSLHRTMNSKVQQGADFFLEVCISRSR